MACNCESNATCACSFLSSPTVTIGGGGSAENPLTIVIETVTLTAESTDTVEALLSGDGTVDSPYSLSLRVDPAVLATMWGRWFGSQAAYDAMAHQPSILYVVNPNA